jgi:hypothetical protein
MSVGRILLFIGFIDGSDGLSVAPFLEPKKMRQTTRRVLSAESQFGAFSVFFSFWREYCGLWPNLCICLERKTQKIVCKGPITFKQFQQWFRILKPWYCRRWGLAHGDDAEIFLKTPFFLFTKTAGWEWKKTGVKLISRSCRYIPHRHHSRSISRSPRYISHRGSLRSQLFP